MSGFVKIATGAEIPEGKAKNFYIKGKKIAVAKVDGKYFAFDDTCTHAECSLSAGFLDDQAITCYCHGAQFDIEKGDVLAPPATVPLKTYQTKVEGDDVLVSL